jgi:hypothetical protein
VEPRWDGLMQPSRGPHEVSANSKHTFHFDILPAPQSPASHPVQSLGNSLVPNRLRIGQVMGDPLRSMGSHSFACQAGFRPRKRKFVRPSATGAEAGRSPTHRTRFGYPPPSADS